MPKPAAYTVDEIFEAIKDLNLHYMDQKKNKCGLYSLTNPVWNRAHEKLPKMSKKYIYLYISSKRNGIVEKILKYRNLPNMTDTFEVDETDDSYTSNWSMNEAQQSLPSFPPLRTTIYVEKKNHVKIKSSIFSMADNDKLSLTSGWTSALYSLLWENLKLPCPFSFKYANINENPGELLLTVRGKCRECCNIVHVYFPTLKLSDKGMAIHVSTFNTTGVVHKKKRFLSGSERLAVVKELQAGSTYVWRRENANEKMNFGDPEPAHLYSEDVLRKAKQIENDKQLCVSNVSDPVQSVETLQYKAEFVGFIREVCSNKFYTFYWSAEQIYLYKETLKCKNCETGSLSIDATGSLISRIKRPDGSSRSIFLYQAVVPFHGKILPVCQVVSEKHVANFISYWLREWRRSGVPNPSKVVTDCSLALLNAVCLAFNDCSLNNYVELSIKWIQSPNEHPRPPCIVRIDIAHLIKFTCRWKCFEGKHFSVKDFFVRCIGLLTKCENINNFRSIACDVLVVALSEMESIDNKGNSCYAAQTRLMQAIKSDSYRCEVQEDCNENNNHCEDSHEASLNNCTAASEIINNLVAKSKSLLINGERPNPYCCKEFLNNFTWLAKLFPLWTVIMTPDKTSIATSSYSEEYFREIKQLILKGKSAVRVDKFLVIHMRSLVGTTQILHALHQTKEESLHPLRKKRKQNELKEVEKCEDEVNNGSKTMRNDDINSQKELLSSLDLDKEFESVQSFKSIEAPMSDRHLNEKERWKGKTRDKKKRGKFLRQCPDIKHRHGRPKSVVSTVPLLKNGLLLGPVKLRNKDIIVRNTCPFDAVSQCLLVALRDSSIYQEYVTSIIRDPCFLLDRLHIL